MVKMLKPNILNLNNSTKKYLIKSDKMTKFRQQSLQYQTQYQTIYWRIQTYLKFNILYDLADETLSY